MAEVAASPTAPAAPPKSRLMLGAAILAFAILVKITGPVLIINSDLSAAWKTALSVGLFIVIPKLLIITIIFVLGKTGFAYLKAICFKALGRAFAPLAPAREVNPVRYRIGLVMFTLPLLETMIMPYLEAAFPGVAELRPIEWSWDIMLLASFFVLGGEFWDKLRALYVQRATVTFPAKERAPAA
jgi:hypothetical protein